MISPVNDSWAMKNMLSRRTVSTAEIVGMKWLNFTLSSKAPAIPLERQFMIPLTPSKRNYKYLMLIKVMEYLTRNQSF